MAPEDPARKWNAIYRERAAARLERAARDRGGGGEMDEPSSLVTSLDAELPRAGKAVDLAGGAGRHAVWLADRGLDVTLADVSEVALELSRERAARAGVALRTLAIDLEAEPPPAGPWDLALIFRFLSRPLYRSLSVVLVPGGMAIIVQPTLSDLARRARPSARYLLEDGELPRLVHGLEVVRYDEGWLGEGHHEARILAVRRADAPGPLGA